MKREAASSRWNRNLLLAILGILLVVLAALIARRRSDPLIGPAAELQRMLLVERELVGVYEQAKTGFAEEKLDAQTFKDVIKSEVLAPWRETESRFRKVDVDGLSGDGKRQFKSLAESMKLREQAWALVADSIRDGSEEGMADATRKAAEADRIEAETLAEMEVERPSP